MTAIIVVRRVTGLGIAGGKEGQGPKQRGKKDKEKEKEKEKGKGKGKEMAAAAKEDKEDKPKDEEAWMAVMMDGCWNKNKSTYHSSNNDYNSFDPFDGIDDLLDDIDQTISADLKNVINVHLEASYLVGTDETHSSEVNLYNSGTSRHMSGFFHQFLNYTETDPVPILTADKRTFQAVGKGDMYVYLPNRDKPNSHILLKDVLYAPKMGITLVSISQITGAGSMVIFSGNFCQIYTKNREVVGEIKV